MTYAKLLIPSLIFVLVGIGHAFADYTPGNGNTTLAQYCINGTCSTPNYNLSNVTAFTQSPNFTRPDYVGLVLSQACIDMEKNNITSDCIKLDRLKNLESVNPLLEGVWVGLDSTYPHKIYPTFKGVWNYYDGPPVILVDPPSDFMKRARILTIQSNSFTWQSPNDINNNTQLVRHLDRFIQSDCNEGIVSSDYRLIRDTVLYMMSDCTKSNYNDLKIIHRTEIPFDLNTMNIKTLTYMHNWNNRTKITEDCIHFKCTDLPKDPFHNKDPKFGW